MKWREVTAVLCDKRMPIRLKSLIYKTVVRPVALYGAECWQTTKTTDEKLHVMEMRMLRCALGFTRLDRIRNTSIRQQLGITAITEKMQEHRLRWYGHVLRANLSTVASLAYNMHVDGKTKTKMAGQNI